MSKRASLDFAAVQAALFAGEKVASVAAEYGISQVYLFQIVRDHGLAYVWTTAAEREALTALRSGQFAVIRNDEAAAAQQLRAQIGAALAEYSSASVPSVASPHSASST